MATTLTLRTEAGTGSDISKGQPLTNSEVDNNFKSLKANKLELDGTTTMSGVLQVAGAGTSGSIKFPSASGNPSGPASGDFWYNSGFLKFYNGSSSEKLLSIPASTTITNGQLLIGDGVTNSFDVASLAGTTNRISVTTGAGTLTLSAPQDIATTSNVTFGSILVGTATSASTGQVKASGDIIAFASSDINLKVNVEPISNALDKVLQLNGVVFDWNETAKSVYNFEGKDTGVIAQEVAQVLPEVVTTRDDGFMAVKYEKMIGLLIEAIKELNSKVENCTCNK